MGDTQVSFTVQIYIFSTFEFSIFGDFYVSLFTFSVFVSFHISSSTLKSRLSNRAFPLTLSIILEKQFLCSKIIQS